MKYGIIAILTVVTIPLVFCWIISSSEKTPQNVIKYPKKFSLLGLATLTISVFCIFIVFSDFRSYLVNCFLFIMVLCISIASIYLILLGLNWKIEILQNHLIYTNIFRISKKYGYSDVTNVKVYYVKNTELPQKYTIYFGKKRITVDYLTINFDSF